MGDLDYSVDEIRFGPDLAQQLAVADILGITVTDDQRRTLGSRSRKKIVAGGERAGKSFYSALELATRVAWGELFWIIGADYGLARPEFEYVVEWLSKLGAFENPKRNISMPKYGKAIARLKTGQVIETRTADDVRKIAARAPDGIVLAEAAQLSYDVFLKALGRLSEKRGWLVASGTFEGSAGWYPELFDEWRADNLDGGQSFSLPTWGNLEIFPGGRNDPEIKRLERVYSKVPGLFEERCGAVPSPAANLVFRQFRETIHHDAGAVYDREKAVFLAVDPSAGTNPYAVGVYQFRETTHLEEAHQVDYIPTAVLVDCIYERGKIDEEIIDIAKGKVWWNNVRGGAIDVEAPDSQRRWRSIGGVNLWREKVEQIEGIRRLQSFLYYKREADGRFSSPPHLLVNPDVSEFAYEVRSYRRPKTSSVRGGISRRALELEPRDVPPSNQPNHLLKATWYLLVARFGYVKAPTRYRMVKTWRNPLRLPSKA